MDIVLWLLRRVLMLPTLSRISQLTDAFIVPLCTRTLCQGKPFLHNIWFGPYVDYFPQARCALLDITITSILAAIASRFALNACRSRIVYAFNTCLKAIHRLVTPRLGLLDLAPVR